MINIEDAVFTGEDGIVHIHVEDILDRLRDEFDMRYELLFKDGDIVHLHSAETLKGIANWIIANTGISLTSYELDSIDNFSDDIKQMKDYLVVAGHLDSPVTPKPRKRDSCGEVKL